MIGKKVLTALGVCSGVAGNMGLQSLYTCQFLQSLLEKVLTLSLCCCVYGSLEIFSDF